MSEIEAGGAVNNSVQSAPNPWDNLKTVSFGGAPAANANSFATRRAEAAASKADNKEQVANAKFTSAEENVKNTYEAFKAAREKYNEADALLNAREEENLAIKDEIRGMKGEIEDKKANNRFFKYLGRQSEAVVGILKAGGGVVTGTISSFAANVVAKMPRIEIKSPISFKSSEKVASETWNDRLKASGRQWNAEEAKRAVAEERVDTARERANELTSRKNQFNEALNKFKANRESREMTKDAIAAAREALSEKKSELKRKSEVLGVLDMNLMDAEKAMNTANLDFKNAEKSYNDAKAKVESAEQKAQEKRLKYDRLKTLADFKAGLGNRSPKAVRRELVAEKNAYMNFVNSMKAEMLDTKVVESTIKGYNEKLDALDLYEAELQGKNTGSGGSSCR